MLGRCSHFAQRQQDAWGQVQQGARVMKGKDQALCRLQPLQCKQKWDHGGLDFQTVSGNWKSSCRIPVLNVRSKQGKRSSISPWSRLSSAPGTAGWALSCSVCCPGLAGLPSPSLLALCVTQQATPRRGHGSTDLPFETFQASMGQAFLPTLSQEKTKATNRL